MNLSIHLRVLSSAFLILFLFLGLTGLVLDKAFRNNVENSQFENLRTQIYTLLATADIDNNNQLVLPDEVTVPRLNMIDSSLHARITKTNGDLIWQSKSMLNTFIAYPTEITLGDFHYSDFSNQSNHYTLLSFSTAWETDLGEESFIFHVAENNKHINKQIALFRTNMWGWLAAMGILLLVVQAFILRWGLKPLRHIANDLLKIEQGKTQRLSGHYPKEISPLTNNLNNLLKTSQQQLTRYRDSLGNMAHSLKTPIAVLHGIIESNLSEHKQNASEQLQAINNIVEYQLQRAATAGRQGSNTLQPIKPVADKILQSLNKVYHDKHIKQTIIIADNLQAKLDKGDLYELLGNLLDNAYKWCNKEIYFKVSNEQSRLQFIIEDDGPGIAEKERERILLRGQRADQNTPGYGLGMAMVSDMLLVYQGSMEITDSPLGGAKIKISL